MNDEQKQRLLDETRETAGRLNKGKSQMNLCAFAAAMAIVAFAAGCQIINTTKEKPGYKTGRLTAAAYIATEPALPSEVSTAIRAGYTVLQLVYPTDAHSVEFDKLMKEIIQNEWPDKSAEFHNMTFTFYRMARARMGGAVQDNPDIPVIRIFRNFKSGVDDALKDYGKTSE